MEENKNNKDTSIERVLLKTSVSMGLDPKVGTDDAEEEMEELKVFPIKEKSNLKEKEDLIALDKKLDNLLVDKKEEYEDISSGEDLSENKRDKFDNISSVSTKDSIESSDSNNAKKEVDNTTIEESNLKNTNSETTKQVQDIKEDGLRKDNSPKKEPTNKNDFKVKLNTINKLKENGKAEEPDIKVKDIAPKSGEEEKSTASNEKGDILKLLKLKDKRRNKNNVKSKESKDISTNRKYKRFSIFGEEKYEDFELENPKIKEIEITRDYKNKEDIAKIRSNLNHDFHKIFVRTLITGVSAFIICFLSVAVQIKTELFALLFSQDFSIIYIYTCLIVVLLCMLVSYSAIISGIKSLFKMQGNTDTSVAFSAFCCLAQLGLAVYCPQRFVNAGLIPIYAFLCILALFMNSLGKLYITLRVRKNFSFICGKFPKYFVKSYENEKNSVKLTSTFSRKKPVIVYQKPTDYLSDFFKISYAPDPSDYLSYGLTIIGVMISVVIGLVELIIKRDIFNSISALALTSCVSIPMSSIFAVNKPLWTLCKELNKRGAMLSGFWGVRKFSAVTSIILRDSDLYPTHSVELKGIKTFGQVKFDEAILCAASILSDIGSPIKDIFDQIVQGEKSILPKVDSYKYKDKKGIIGYVGSNQILIGSRELLKLFNISCPSEEFEEKYKQKQLDITYLACNGRLYAAFILEYKPDIKIACDIQRLEYDSLNILVKTLDHNITAEKIAKDFDIYPKTVRIIPTDFYNEFESLTRKSEKSSRAYIATKGQGRSILRAISGAIRIKSNIGLAMATQLIAMILAVLIVSFLILFTEIERIGSWEILSFTIFWILAVTIPPRIRKP